MQAFLRDARARNCSASTLANYRSYLLGPRAQQFVADYRIDSVADITADNLRGFQAELLDAGVSPGTAGTFHRVIRNFMGFCTREGYGVYPETLEVPAPRQPEVEPETFTPEEEQAMLKACKTPRDRMIVEFMLRTGLRLEEVVNVTLDDIIDNASGGIVRVRQGKGRKDRIVPLDTGSTRFSRRIDAYVKKDRPPARSRNLFLSTRQDPRTGDYPALDRDGLKSMLARLGEQTGIHVHAHKFRHTFATRALAAGVDSLVLQRALGHTTLAMVNRYVHFQTDDLVEAWQARRD